MKLKYFNVEQGSDEWKTPKLGVISGSNIYKVLAKKGTETRAGYLMDLVGQIATRRFDEINGKALEHGTVNEPAARAAYEFETGHKVEQTGFIYCEERRIGVSPDGLIPSINKGLEIKNPFTSRVHADFICNDKVKPEYQLQVMFSLYVTGFETWDFCSYHSAFKTSMLKIKTFERDKNIFERFENEIPEFLNELDEALKKINLKWGDQWP
ncbi:MAG: lambda exonuclease family protein [Bacteriovoracaceae bacterium]